MQADLEKMKKELSAILIGNYALKQAMREVNKMNMIKASMIVRSPKHRTLMIEKILEGELQKDVAIGDYVFIQKYCDLLRATYNNLEMGNSVNGKLLSEAYKILAEKENGRYRDSNPVVYSLNHVPPHCSDIDTKLTAATKKIYSREIEDDLVAKVMYLHNSIIDIWPFEEYNGEITIFAVNYFLLEQGLMPIDMPIDRQDYIELITASLKGRELKEEYLFFRNAIFEKMASTIEICRGYTD